MIMEYIALWLYGWGIVVTAASFADREYDNDLVPTHIVVLASLSWPMTIPIMVLLGLMRHKTSERHPPSP